MTHIACILFSLLSIALFVSIVILGQSDVTLNLFAFWMLSLAVACVCSSCEDYNWRDF